MNSRFNLGGFSVPQNREIQSNNPWIPVTPQQPVPARPNATLSNTDGSLPGSSSWWELADLQHSYLEEMPSACRLVQNLVQSGELVQMPPSYGRSIHNLVQSEKRVQMPSYGIPAQNLSPNGKSQQIGANIQNSCMQQTPSNSMPLGSLILNGRLGHDDANIQDGHWQELPNYGRAIENLIQNRTPVQNEPNLQDGYLQEMFIYCMPVQNSIQSKSSVQNEANIQHNYLQQMLSYDRSLQNNAPRRESVQSGENFSFDADINDSNQMNGPIPTSFTELLNMEGMDWGQGLISGILASENASFMPLAVEIPSRPMTKDNIFLNLDSPAAPSSHRGFTSRSTLSNQNGVSGAMPMPEPSRPMYDLNSLPGIEADDPQIVNDSIQFAPPTPEQAKLGNIQFIEVLDSVVDDNQGKQKQLVLFTKNEASSNQSDELLQSIVDSSKKKDTATDREQGIDLNKTPQPKPPKRRKHRPKVIVEGKPKSSKTSRSSEKPRSKENHSGKRKYVRKKGIKESGSQQPVVMNETTDCKVRTAGKSCQRALNFDVEKFSVTFDMEKTTAASGEGRKEIKRKATTDYGVNVSPQSAKSSNLCNIRSDPLIGLQKKSTTEHHQVNKHNFTSSMDERRATDHFSLEKLATSTCPLASHTDKEMDARGTTKLVNIASDINWPNSLKNIQKAMQQYDYVGGQMAHERGGNLGNLIRSTQLVTERITKSIPAAPSNSNITKITKRDHIAIEQADLNMNSSSSSYLLQRMFQADECQNVNRGVLDAYKKKKIAKRPRAENHGTQSFVPPAFRDNKLGNGVISGISQPYAGSVNSSEITSHSRYLSNQCLELVPLARYTNTSAAHHQNADRKEESSSLTQAAHLASQQATQNHSLMIMGMPEPNKLMEHHILLRTEVSASTKCKSGRTKKSLQHKNKDIIHEKQYSVGKEKGSESTIELMDPISIDGIIEKLKVLNLSEKIHELMKPTENAIVLYNGEGSMVPYENKRRKPRPKVDLDPETNRMWNLLMGKQASEGYAGNDMEKENWWRNEREVFHGRANSFIARMHLVQGDRRFSPWKGSVVDSVIGVFLTQNVSDHLSSSAFMLLAARFPVGSRNNRTSNRYAEGILVEPQEGIMMNPTEIIRYRPNIQPICNSSSVECWRDGATSGIQRTILSVLQGHSGEEDVISSQESFECSAVEGNGAFRSYSGSNSESEDFSISVKSKMTNVFNLNSSTPKQKYINDSYSCLNTSTLAYQTPKNRFQQSKDEAYNNQNPRLDRTCKTNTSPASSHLIGSGNTVLFPPASSGQHNLQLTLDSTISKAGGYDALTEESISSWPTASRSTKFKEVNHTVEHTRKQPGSKDKSRVHPQGLLHYEETLSSQCIVSSRNIMQQQNDCHLSIDAAYSQPTFNNDQCQMKFFHPDANHPDVAGRQFDLAQYASTNPNHIQTVTGESTPEMSQNYPANSIVHPTSEVPNRSSVKINNREATIAHATATTEKGKLKIDSKNKINWDNLRKEVQRAHGKKERNRDAMDSIDYEAVRKSSVSEISAVIKERGMNNMLAERIKEFLDRLVREHGSTDLEWLRDVPPDQVKDYLLSIRGLGLKSVECVRLLTLHHVAFPVDTNVGRIAVRLGWVPLQPLPEELQLHLLELYPVLESIQKYLWPRLCKLDQQTLYELHYQLITFGKVFCTKTRPNCNACPMRGECRHFASAFASARLALPGPEENRMVASEAPIVYSNPSIAINAAPMTPLMDHSFNRAVTMCSSEPIVEHPASPEKNSTAVPDSDIEDIEDALCEEEEEQIPTIRLNMDEFSENLQSYMQGNMELQEVDMSKALVALSEQAASIPAQKLKNITRLRTEHQVYELPDDHPLLEGIDKREPDDPSPYLLAIWAPGETANSTESAQMGCQGSGPLCNEETCSRCNSIQEAYSQTIRGTLLIPCRTAMRGSFPLNGTYFQVNEMFTDHASSINPICVPRESIWNLRRRTVFFGSSVSSIFRGLSTEQIQYCFWRGFVCVRGFDQETRAPRPLAKWLHTSPSKLVKTNRGRRA